jgi:hypothetical protein
MAWAVVFGEFPWSDNLIEADVFVKWRYRALDI